ARHHEGQEEAARGQVARRARERHDPHQQVRSLRRAARARRRREGERRRRARRQAGQRGQGHLKGSMSIMSDVLVVAELTEQAQRRSATLSAITVAKKAQLVLGGKVAILVLGSSVRAAADELTGYGAEKLIVCEDASLAHYTAEHFSPTVAEVGKNYALLVAT